MGGELWHILVGLGATLFASKWSRMSGRVARMVVDLGLISRSPLMRTSEHNAKHNS